MQSKRYVATLVLVSTLVPSALHADWQYTHWGMSESDANTLKIGHPNPHVYTHGSWKLAFDVSFQYADHKLETVELKCTPETYKLAPALKTEMVVIYGPPLIDTGASGAVWVDRAHGNVVSLYISSLMSECHVYYRSLPSTEGGL
jgi:hypothetical protein